MRLFIWRRTGERLAAGADWRSQAASGKRQPALDHDGVGPRRNQFWRAGRPEWASAPFRFSRAGCVAAPSNAEGSSPMAAALISCLAGGSQEAVGARTRNEDGGGGSLPPGKLAGGLVSGDAAGGWLAGGGRLVGPAFVSELSALCSLLSAFVIAAGRDAGSGSPKPAQPQQAAVAGPTSGLAA